MSVHYATSVRQRKISKSPTGIDFFDLPHTGLMPNWTLSGSGNENGYGRLRGAILQSSYKLTLCEKQSNKEAKTKTGIVVCLALYSLFHSRCSNLRGTLAVTIETIKISRSSGYRHTVFSRLNAGGVKTRPRAEPAFIRGSAFIKRG